MSYRDHMGHYLEDIEKELKPFNSTEHLIDIGVFNNAGTAKNWRSLKIGPAYVELPGARIRYPKSSILKWLEETSKSIQTMKNK